MELSTATATSTKPPAPKRQETLGPSSPIQDWEVERATILVESKSSREKAERLEKKLETDRQTFERDTMSLLREVKLKEAFMEKKLKDVEEQLMNDILELQRRLDEEKISRQQEIQTIRHQHEQALEQEDKKYQRRLVALQERLNAKDTEYAELLKKEKSGTETTDNDEEKDKLVESLKLELAKKEKSQNNQQQRELNSFATTTENTNATAAASAINDDNSQNVAKEYEELQSHCKSIEQKLQAAESKLHESQQQQQTYMEKVQALESQLAAAQKQSQVYKKRLDQTLSSHDDQVKELTEKFMSEAQQSQMTNQAQLQNLQSEHTELMRELREQHETEKEVWTIEQRALIDEIRRDANFEKEEAIRALNRKWNDKNEDLHASMSKDAMEIQKHWETKLEEAKAKALLKESRLQGEMEVIKDRLGREIQRRKQNQAALAEAVEKNRVLDDKTSVYQKKCTELLKQRAANEKETNQLKTQYRSSHRLALDLLAVTSPSFSTVDSRTNLPDILQAAVRQVSIMRIHGETSQDHHDSSFDMETIPTYGF